MTRREQRALTLRFITLSDTLQRTEAALQHGSIRDALDQLQEGQQVIASMSPAEIDVTQAGTVLGVSAPTVRAWARRELMEVVQERPMMLSLSSVVELRDRLERLRNTAANEKRWQALLTQAADQREFAEPGAREGLADALAGDVQPLTRK
jgi:hypothetical protein